MSYRTLAIFARPSGATQSVIASAGHPVAAEAVLTETARFLPELERANPSPSSVAASSAAEQAAAPTDVPRFLQELR